jgi:hypothetical protein
MYPVTCRNMEMSKIVDCITHYIIQQQQVKQYNYTTILKNSLYICITWQVAAARLARLFIYLIVIKFHHAIKFYILL